MREDEAKVSQQFSIDLEAIHPDRHVRVNTSLYFPVPGPLSQAPQGMVTITDLIEHVIERQFGCKGFCKQTANLPN